MREECEGEWTDERGQRKRQRFERMAARSFQHEHDHLNGVLFVDRMKQLDRTQFFRKLARSW
jgi:peptide deformylase